MRIPQRNIDNTLTGRIITLVCEAWGISRSDLVGKARRRPLPWARAMLCEYLRKYAGHDSVSCSAILDKTYEGISHYQVHYREYMQTYVRFNTLDQQLRKQLEAEVRKYASK